MPTYDPIDLNAIKQEVFFEFFDFHLKNDEVWAILNESSVLFASDLFKQAGLEHFLYDIFYFSFSNLLKNDFVDVISKKIVVSFSSYHHKNLLHSSPIYIIEISKFNNKSFYLKGINLFSNNLSLYDINILKKNDNLKKIPIDRFKFVNPSKELLEDEWKISWLFISGLSYRQIASFLNFSRTTIENKMKSSYGKLELLGEESFKYVADVYSWKKYIPNDLLSDFFIEIV